MDLIEWILDGRAHSIAWSHILCVSFINVSHIVDEFESANGQDTLRAMQNIE